MIELLLFLFTDFDNRMGYFHTVEQKFHTYEHCIEYEEKNRIDNPDGMGQIFIPTGQVIGLTYCKPIDTDK